MENASKALLMAGEILIAILIIGLIVYMFNSAGQLFKTSEDVEQTEQITAFNKEYEAYNRKLMRGTDIISIINKVNSNNKKYEELPEYKITVEFKLVEDLGYKKTVDDGKSVIVLDIDNKISKGNYKNDSNEWITIKNNVEAFTDFKRRVFDCTYMGYNPETGRVNAMYFKEKLIDYTEGL